MENKGINSLQAAIKNNCSSFNAENLHDVNCRYCSRYFWVLERASQYATAGKTTVEKVLASWETARDYWYMNFYQDAHQPDLDNSKIEVISYDDWRKELTGKFGDDPNLWKFKCVSCGNIQCKQDFTDIGVDGTDKVYFSCLGRWKKGVGCDWTLGGLLSIHKRIVISPELTIVPVFETA